MGPIKTLLIDIETAPALVRVYDLWRQNISINKIVKHVEMICFAAKWQGAKKVFFYSTHHHGQEVMLEKLHSLLTQADVVMHYNGVKFDVRHINREFLEAGLAPPAPFQQIDLYKTVKKQFAFMSNKLQNVSQRMGLAGKVPHEGDLQEKCQAGDEQAWRLMKRYNIQDVRLLEDLYEPLRPWIVGHPNLNLYIDSLEPMCHVCGSTNLTRQGHAYTSLGRYQRLQCKDCGTWGKGAKREAGAEIRAVTS